MAAANLAPSFDARKAMERLNAEAGKAPHLAADPGQRARAAPVVPRNRYRGERVRLPPAGLALPSSSRLPIAGNGANRALSRPHRRDRARRRCSPIEFAERQQFLLTNPGLGGRLQVTSTMRCAVFDLQPRDVAPVHIHTPECQPDDFCRTAAVTPQSKGKRCEAARGDLILTPNGTWHDHGNDGSEPVVWIDVLDFPLMEFLDCVWLDEAFPGDTLGNSRAQTVTHAGSYSQRLYGQGGLVPRFVAQRRGFGVIRRRCSTTAAPMSAKPSTGCGRKKATRTSDRSEVRQPGDRSVAVSDTGLRGTAAQTREATRFKRETRQHALHCDGRRGSHRNRRTAPRLAGQRHFVGAEFCVAAPRQQGRALTAVLYTVSDAPLIEKIGQYRAQGRLRMTRLPSSSLVLGLKQRGSRHEHCARASR